MAKAPAKGVKANDAPTINNRRARYDYEILDTYECGLESRGDSWVQLNVQYYIYALAFVAFDLEAPFLYAWAVVFNKLPLVVFFEMLVFIAVLMVGLIYAWKKGVLEWK